MHLHDEGTAQPLRDGVMICCSSIDNDEAGAAGMPVPSHYQCGDDVVAVVVAGVGVGVDVVAVVVAGRGVVDVAVAAAVVDVVVAVVAVAFAVVAVDVGGGGVAVVVMCAYCSLCMFQGEASSPLLVAPQELALTRRAPACNPVWWALA